MFTPPSPDILAAAEEAFRARALERGREQAEIAADLRGAPTSPEERAAWIAVFAEEWAANFIQGAREERARIKNILGTPGMSMLMPNEDGTMCHLRSHADGVVRSEKRQPRISFAGRAL